MLARVGLHLGAIDRQHAELHDARFAGNPHDLHEQRLEGGQALLPKLGDRSVHRKVAGCQHAIGHVLAVNSSILPE